MMMRVFLLSRHDLGKTYVAEQFRKGLAHNPRPYGFEAAERPGVHLEYSESSPYTRLQRLGWGLLGFDLIHALRNRAALRSADVIWTVLEWEWLPVALLQRLRVLPNKPVIGNSVWLFQNWPSWGRKRRLLWRWLMTDSIHLTLHSKAALDVAIYSLPGKRFHLVPFGISTLAFPLQKSRTWSVVRRAIKIYSIGDDRTRDWKTMLAAFGNDERFDLRIICRWIDEDVTVADFRNLDVPRAGTISDQRAAFEWADVVVMPMKPNVFSGITVVCEAVAMGTPVVSSRTGGVPTYFAEDEVKYVEPLEPEALRKAVLSTTAEEWNRQAARATVRFEASDYSAKGMADRYLAISHRLVRPEQS